MRRTRRQCVSVWVWRRERRRVHADAYGILAGCGGGWWTFAENGLLRRSLMERCHSCREIGEYCSARKMTEFDVSGCGLAEERLKAWKE